MKLDSLHQIQVTTDNILFDPLIKALPSLPPRKLIERVLREIKARALDLNILADMDFEELIHFLYVTNAQVLDDDLEGEDCSVAPISISVDTLGVRAVITLHQGKGRGPTEEQLRHALAERGIVSGIREEFILRLAEHPIYNRRFRIAEGVPPQNGQDGGAIFHFDVKKSLSLEPSTPIPDFKDMDFAEYVHEGDLLCELTPPTAGCAGHSVMGEILQGALGAVSNIKPGTNATLSPEGTKIYAACDGQAFYKNGRVGVSRVMVLDQVDQSTGNIIFVGSVLVRGDVEDGRLIQAGGNVTVCGHVKNAKLAAGRNLILINGITSTGEGMLSAEGSIRARFIEQARVKAGGNIYSDSILNAHIECGGSVYLDGQRGRLIGGSCVATQSVTARELGNRASIRTSISIKQQNVASSQLERQVQLKRYQTTFTSIQSIAKSITLMENQRTEQLTTLVHSIYILQQLDGQIRAIEDELSGRNHNLMSTYQITASQCLHPDVHLEICGIGLETTVELGPCVVSNGGNRLIIASISDGSATADAHEKGGV